MVRTGIATGVQRALAQGIWGYGLRIAIALGSVMALCWWQDRLPQVIALFLGIIVSAIAETDDSWRGRTRALAVTLLCFALVAFGGSIRGQIATFLLRSDVIDEPSPGPSDQRRVGPAAQAA